MKNKTQGKIKRVGSGRTKGSFSFVSIPLAELVAKFKDTNTPITVGRKFAESVGIKAVSAPAAEITSKIQGTNAASSVGAKSEDFDAAEAAAPVAPAAAVAS